MSSGSQIITEYSGASRETLVSTNSFNEDMLILFAAMVSFPQAHLLRARGALPNISYSLHAKNV
jgi:hypothetical protein